jgi:peptidoglycan/xylan/chitin deacetylase (PgdA/CDA1 family)
MLIALACLLPLQVTASELLSACWPPEKLLATSAERSPVRHVQATQSLAPILTPLPAAPVQSALRGSIRRVDLPQDQKLVALTFDLCETGSKVAGYDGEIVDLLRSEGIKATFFASGKWLETHPERAAQLVADPRFEIGNHTWTHVNLSGAAPDRLIAQISLAQAAYEDVRGRLVQRQCALNLPKAVARIPSRMSLFRFPFGACNAHSLRAVNDAGLLAIQWDIVTGDPSPQQSARAIVRAVMRQIRPGSIIIAHANGRGHHTAEALRLIIPRLKASGYGFATVSELLSLGKPIIAGSCFEQRPGDTARYDRFAWPKSR